MAYGFYDEIALVKHYDLTTVKGISVNDELLPLYPGYNPIGSYSSAFARSYPVNSLVGRQIPQSEWNQMEHITGADTAGKETYGWVFGDDNTPATKDDYSLAGNAVYGYSYLTKTNWIFGDEYIDYQILYTITNTSSKSITIGEIGLFDGIFLYPESSASTRRYHVMIERTAFDTPITIEPDGVGQVTYTLRLAKRIS